jgi:heme/copper-type cytochrome/quinol oxidase subunit 2
MNRWIKIVTPTLLAAVVVALLLMLSGLGTISLLDNNDKVVTQTIVKLDVNTFAIVMIAGVALTVLFTGILFQSSDKPAPAPPEPQPQQP